MAGIILPQLVAFIGEHAGDLVAEREGPGQRFGPVALEDVQIGAADTAGLDLDEPGAGRYGGVGHGLDLRRGTGS